MKIEIPSYVDSTGETIELECGYSAHITIECDQDAGMPWEREDGHGPVSDWTTRDKRPGEMVLNSDGRSKRYYDFAEAVRIARRDGWDAPPYKTGTKGDQAHRAAMRDFEYLRQWCANDWYYVGVIVKLSRNGAQVGDDSLWGIESFGDYWKEVAREMIEELIAADKRERAERRYWEARDVVTE